jgi:predicted AAA+ superfamily ATPase
MSKRGYDMASEYINRPEYLEKLIKWQIDSDMIKIVTGVRRCGKSVLFKLFQEHLLEHTKVRQNQIININLEDPVQVKEIGLELNEQKTLASYYRLLDFVLSKLNPDTTVMNYVFIDEIQLLENWQQAANGLRLRNNVDLYLTGSNAYMFSSELATLLGGRYTEIKMQPLSFKEYVDGTESARAPLMDTYLRYITESAFPQTLKYNRDKQLINDYLRDTVYRNTVSKDIIQRFKLKDEIKLDNVILYLFDNISNETSVLGIEKALQINGKDVSNDSISKYVNGLLDSYLMYKCERYDLKGKRILSSSPKYYVCDAGLRSVVLGRELRDTGRVLENVVYLELLRRGYDVCVGKIDKKNAKGDIIEIEVDFIATKANGIKEYYQVTNSITDEAVAAREIRSLEAIDDNYPKYILTMDLGNDGHKGIQRLNILEWLLG